jgi:hypothetical protein
MMLQIIVDWIGRRLGSQPEVVPPVTDAQLEGLTRREEGLTRREEGLTRREEGIRFQREEFERLLNAIGHWETVEFFTADGVRIESIEDVPKGADGGIDAIIRIVADTEHGAKIIAGRIRRMIVTQKF